MASSSHVKSAALSLWLLVLAPEVATALDPQPPALVTVRWDSGEPSEGVCGWPSFSPNSRFLTFGCYAGDLVPGDSNDRPDSFIVDRYSGEIERVSVSSGGQEMLYDSFGGYSASTGEEVAFVGFGPLHPDYGPPPLLDLGRSAVYLRRRALGETELISRDAFDQVLSGSVNLYAADFSRREILIDYRGDIRTGPNSSFSIGSQIWVKNWETGAVELVSGTPAGELAGGASYLASFSATGRFVVFQSTSDDLGPAARLGDQNLYLRDRASGAIERLTFPFAGGEFQAPFQSGGTPPKVSSDGRFVVFASISTELHPNITEPSGTHVFLLDRQTGSLDHLSTTAYPSFNLYAQVSADGRYVAWTSRNFSFLGPPDPPADMRAIWVLDRQTGERVNVAAPLGPLHNDPSISMALSPDGSAVAFSWRITDPASPLFDRLLLYTVDLRGTQPPAPQPVPVPMLSLWMLAVLGGASMLLARRRIHAGS
jgi:Tol biopolymer transport system component